MQLPGPGHSYKTTHNFLWYESQTKTTDYIHFIVNSVWKMPLNTNINTFKVLLMEENEKQTLLHANTPNNLLLVFTPIFFNYSPTLI